MVMKKNITILLILIGLIQTISGQNIIPPYTNSFDNISDTTGWSHYAIVGTDDWEIGTPNGTYFSSPLSSPNLWATKLDTFFTPNSIMCLETPSFDLSDTLDYILAFSHLSNTTYSADGGNIEYSIDNGNTWTLLYGSTNTQVNWHGNAQSSTLGQPAWTGSFSGYKFSRKSLSFLSGQNSVKFRFKFGGSSTDKEGWAIDNFMIVENTHNIIGINGTTYDAAENFPTFGVDASYYYDALVPKSPLNLITEFYISNDSIFDAGDTLIYTKTTGGGGGGVLNMVPNIHYGDYYIFVKCDANNELTETNENDNLSYSILHIDSTFTTEYREDFESPENWWKTDINSYWEKGKNSFSKIFGSHSGDSAWYISQPPISGSSATIHNFTSPFLDLSVNSVICFWYKIRTHETTGPFNINMKLYRYTTYPVYTGNISLNYTPRFTDWDCHCSSLSGINGYDNVKVGFEFESDAHITNYADQLVIDDIYIGPAKPDLSIEHEQTRILNNLSAADTLFYTVFNGGSAPTYSSQTQFYWSTDSLLDGSDLLLGYQDEDTLYGEQFKYNKFVINLPTNQPGRYFIITKVDANNTNDESWETNNITTFPVISSPRQMVPYYNDFETEIDNWHHLSFYGTDEWHWSSPQGTDLQDAFSGVKAFITKPTGDVSSSSLMVLYTPSFDLSGLINPVLEFEMHFIDSNTSGIYKPYLNMSYSIDNGRTWNLLDSSNLSCKNWYETTYYDDYGGYDKFSNSATSDLLFDPTEKTFGNSNKYQGKDIFIHSKKQILDITPLKEFSQVQFRYNFVTPDSSLGEGVLIDNFSIQEKQIDLAVDYKKTLYKSPLVNQLRFFMHINNHGNYISNSTNVNFYISSDTIFDVNDVYVGTENLPPIKPDSRYYLNTILYSVDLSLGAKYLIYNIDESNTNQEINESNNTSYWSLGIEGIHSFPYISDFSDTIVNGWTEYTKTNAGGHLKNSYRFRNTLGMHEIPSYNECSSQQMFTDRINSVKSMSQVPFMYLESPSFNFKGIDSVFLSFDLFCTGRTSLDGGNMEFSTNGGNTWNILTMQQGNTYNWYNSNSSSILDDLNNQNGWTGLSTFDSTSIDLSFLKGEENIVFRYKYRSNYQPGSYGSPHGMRIDNFKIHGAIIDYKSNDSNTVLNISSSQSNFDVNYSISNIEDFDGKISNTKFYWSTDSLLDSDDELITTLLCPIIAANSTFNDTVNITPPFPISQLSYYLIYLIDADSLIQEIDETNNIGIFEVNFDSITYFCNLSASFSHTNNGNGNYLFTNSSTGTFNQSHWAFGDGTTSSSTNPNHTFISNGNFVVTLTIQDSIMGMSCLDYFNDYIIVTGVPSPAQCIAGYVMYPDTLNGEIFVVNSSTGVNLTYLWDFGDGNTSTQAYPTHTYAASGPFYLCLTVDDGAGCTDMYCDSIGENGVIFKQTGFSINVIAPPVITGLENDELSQKVAIYPNPASEQLTIVSDQTIHESIIIDITGKAIKSIKENTKVINVDYLSSGIYFIKLITNEGTITKKFVKQ
jgi:hypothetical protein